MFPTQSTVAAPAKINLHLRILGIRPDGFHELRTLFYPIHALSDALRIEPARDCGLRLQCPDNPELEGDDNLIAKAWQAFGAETGFQPGLSVTLTKRIPMGGGLGGGSSDAAAMLRWLNAHAGDTALSLDALIPLAAGLGADVPFFLLDGPAWAGGIGEALTPTDVDLSGLRMLLACPDVHVDTPWAFRAWDKANGFPAVSESLTTPPLDTKNPSPVSPPVVTNDFEAVVFAKHPVLRGIKETLLRHGAAAAAMSGSGASLFGLFRSGRAADQAAEALQRDGIDIHAMECG